MADFRLYDEITIGINGNIPSEFAGGAEALLARFNAFLSNTFSFRLSPTESGETEFSFGDSVDVTPVLGGILPTFDITPPFIDYSGTDASENLFLADTTTAEDLEQWRFDLNQFITEANASQGTNVATFEEDLDDPTTGLGQIFTDPTTVVFYNGSTPAASDTDDIGPLPVCFAAGTMIATPSGEVAVETLAVGDTVLTADGREATVAFVGRQTLVKAFTPRDWFCPVRIRAGALGDSLPKRDLVLTADHAIRVGDVLANAGALVNGTSITRVPHETLAARVVYYHVETAAHELILAEGVAAETYLDSVQPKSFDNHREYLALGRDRAAKGTMLPLPRALSRRQLPQDVRALLARRAEAIGAVPDALAS